jgi:uncharacterized protein
MDPPPGGKGQGDRHTEGGKMTVAPSTEALTAVRSFPKEWTMRPRIYTLCTTFHCNLACQYCYVNKNPAVMTLETARRAVDFIFRHSTGAGAVDIGFFGGEPLLEFRLLQEITEMIEAHPGFNPGRVSLSITTNGTLLTGEVLTFLKEHAFKVTVSCDGAPHVQDLNRRSATGKGTSTLVERNLLVAQALLGNIAVNAVYAPQTLGFLPESLAYFSSLGLRHIHFSADYTAIWSPEEMTALPAVYRAVADQFVAWYRGGDPHFVNLIDTKISVLMRGGYHPLERCLMGVGELTITPDGGLYPCERLVGSGSNSTYRIGSIETGVEVARLKDWCAPGGSLNHECRDCSMRNYCVNWCGCSNIFMTGHSNRVGPFLCASERAALRVAADIYTELGSLIGDLANCHPVGMSSFIGDR